MILIRLGPLPPGGTALPLCQCPSAGRVGHLSLDVGAPAGRTGRQPQDNSGALFGPIHRSPSWLPARRRGIPPAADRLACKARSGCGPSSDTVICTRPPTCAATSSTRPQGDCSMARDTMSPRIWRKARGSVRTTRSGCTASSSATNRCAARRSNCRITAVVSEPTSSTPAANVVWPSSIGSATSGRPCRRSSSCRRLQPAATTTVETPDASSVAGSDEGRCAVQKC